MAVNLWFAQRYALNMAVNFFLMHAEGPNMAVNLWFAQRCAQYYSNIIF